MKKKGKKNKYQAPSDLYSQVRACFEQNPREEFNIKQIAHRVTSNNKKMRSEIEAILQVLLKEDKIEESRIGKYRYASDFSLLSGTIDFTSRGAAFVSTEELEDDIHISPALVGNALQGDIVTVELLYQKRDRRPEGRVIEVIERKKIRFVGTVERLKNYAFVVPDDNKLHIDFFVPLEKLGNAQTNDKVVIEMTDWPANTKSPYAKVLDVLGPAGEHETEMHAIINEYGFETRFPVAVEEAAARLSAAITKEELKKRKDFRKVLTFTIDPADAKDFDDALSYRVLENGNTEVGVHIADVSHYVTAHSILDEEAIKRGTSVYLVDRTIPMLPERLSNELCSLRPDEESLCFSVIFELNGEGHVQRYDIAKAVIYSDKRFSYEEAQEIIDQGEGLHFEALNHLNEMSKKMRERRFKSGSIAFDSDEVRFVLDEQGKPIDVIPKERGDTHKMIEEYMLLANKTVAEHVHLKMKGHFIPNRVHEPPNLEKMSVFLGIAAKFGYRINTKSHEQMAHDINNMVSQTEGKKEASILHPLAVRSMEKAFYSTKSSGHFGLAFSHYSHFTSPIRRYPDLVTHRLLYHYQHHEQHQSQQEVEQLCKQSSKMEQKSSEAERASVKYKQTEFLSSHIGEEFEGIISGVTEWGIYVELIANHCEGMIRLKDLPGDLFEYYEKEQAVIGRRTKKQLTLGDTVWVLVKKTNMFKRTVDLELLEE